MVYILLGNGFEEVEALTALDLLRRAQIPVLTVGINGKHITGGHDITVATDVSVGQMDLTDMDMVVLPGGLGGVASIRSCKEAMDAITFAWDNGKFVAAICAAPTILAQLHITDGKNTTCYPGCEAEMGCAVVHSDLPCIRDGKLITGASAGCAVPFSLMLIAALKGDDAAEAIRKQIVIR